jgi:hypothetical protein
LVKASSVPYECERAFRCPFERDGQTIAGDRRRAAGDCELGRSGRQHPRPIDWPLEGGKRSKGRVIAAGE